MQRKKRTSRIGLFLGHDFPSHDNFTSPGQIRRTKLRRGKRRRRQKQQRGREELKSESKIFLPFLQKRLFQRKPGLDRSQSCFNQRVQHFCCKDLPGTSFYRILCFAKLFPPSPDCWKCSCWKCSFLTSWWWSSSQEAEHFQQLVYENLLFNLKFNFPGLVGGAAVCYTPAVVTRAYTLLSRKDFTKMFQ